MSDQHPRSIADQADAWFARLQDADASDDERRRFQAWYAADQRHAQAYERTRQLWSLLQLPAERVAERLQAESRPAPSPPPRAAIPFRRYLAGASAALLMMAWLLPARIQDWRSDYRTGPGQQTNVTLADGSRIMLNTDTALAIRFGARERRVVLLRGEAFFEVAPDPAKPFIVDGGHAEARAVGTAYGVKKSGADLAVTVAEGTVEVGDGVAAQAVRAMQRTEFKQGRLQAPQHLTNDDSLAWRRRQVVFQQQPLSEVLAEVNRYRAGRIVAVSSELGGRIVSGVFNLGDPQAIVDALQATLNAQAAHLPGDWVLLYY
ncbi:FecR family protein [Methylomonas sp. CM2]|uniref:FecR family protein n=1 Tax=Methylomonas sp. CM2 TaxID=3417647 RepID=UPI003CEF9C84